MHLGLYGSDGGVALAEPGELASKAGLVAQISQNRHLSTSSPSSPVSLSLSGCPVGSGTKRDSDGTNIVVTVQRETFRAAK